MRKSIYKYDWEHGYTIEKKLSSSFDTLQEAVSFANGKNVLDIYKSKGRYKVEWIKVKDNNS